MSRVRCVAVSLCAAVVAVVASVPLAEPQPPVLAFDFDDDGDPGTVIGEVSAEPGTLVEAYLVVNDFPAPYEFLGGMQFGLDFTDGLSLEGIQVATERAGILTDGHQGIAVAIGVPFTRHDLPFFAGKFIFRVDETTPQSVEVVR